MKSQSSSKNFLTRKRIIITGGTGFIGSHLLTEIVAQKPSKILVLSRGSNTHRIHQHLPSILLKRYRSSKEYIQSIISFDADYLFLLGGNADPRLSLDEPFTDFEHNLFYNFLLLEELRKKKNTKIRIIHTSSVAVYGESKPKPLQEINPTFPKSPYGVSKLAIEGYLRVFCQIYGMKGTSVRLFSTYGPGLYKQVVYDFIKALLSSPEALIIRGDGTEVRDLCYIDDQIRGLLLIAKKAKYVGEVYNLGSGKSVTIAQLALKLTRLMNTNTKIVYKKDAKEQHHGSTWIADINKAKQLGHIPKIRLDQGLKKTIEWVMHI